MSAKVFLEFPSSPRPWDFTQVGGGDFQGVRVCGPFDIMGRFSGKEDGSQAPADSSPADWSLEGKHEVT